MRALVAGAGIACPTLAYWLVRHGFAVTIVEHAPALRQGGYVIDFGTLGYDVAAMMDGLIPSLRKTGYQVREVQYVDTKGRRIAGASIDGYTPRDELVYVLYSEIGRQAARFAMHDGRTLVLLTFRDPSGVPLADRDAQIARLRSAFANAGWECPQILAPLDHVTDLYFDRVSQIRFAPGEPWHRGRVVLLGDAASCVSLLAGEGSSLAMAAAYILAGELARAGGDFGAAFRAYEARFRPYVEVKQRTALRFASSFAPTSRLSMLLRNAALDLMNVPWLGDRIIAVMLQTRFSLPLYDG